MTKNRTSFQKGHGASEEVRRKISIGNKGLRKHSEEWKRKLSDRMIANHPMKGRHHSLETRKKIKEARKRQVGSNHPMWKGGITPEHTKLRNSEEGRLWRKAVFLRDSFTCQKTGKRGGDLVAHHINNFSEFKELRTSLENGVTLSKESHNEFHKLYGKKNNTKEQLLEFLKN